MNNKQLKERVEGLLDRVYCPPYEFLVGYGHGGVWLRVEFWEDHHVNKWSSRKWFISPHSTDSEIVQTAFKCVLTSAEHEIREKFLFDDVAVYGPHFDVEDLKELAKERGEAGAR